MFKGLVTHFIFCNIWRWFFSSNCSQVLLLLWQYRGIEICLILAVTIQKHRVLLLRLTQMCRVSQKRSVCDACAFGSMSIPSHHIIITRVFCQDTFNKSNRHTWVDQNIWPRAGSGGLYIHVIRYVRVSIGIYSWVSFPWLQEDAFRHPSPSSHTQREERWARQVHSASPRWQTNCLLLTRSSTAVLIPSRSHGMALARFSSLITLEKIPSRSS